MIDTTGKRVLALVAAALLVCGCGGPSVPPPGSQPLGAVSVKPLSAEPSRPESAVDASHAEESAGESSEESTSDGEGETQTPVIFEPPYPERRNLFHPPQLQRIARTAGSDPDDLAADIRLLGFVGTGQRRAVLDFNGQVQTVAPGEAYAGVELIELTDYEVILRRGRARWTLSLLAD